MRMWTGDDIKRVRKVNKMRQPELAQIMGFDVKTLRGYENNYRDITPTLSMALTHFFGYTEKPLRFYVDTVVYRIEGVVCDICGKGTTTPMKLNNKRRCKSCAAVFNREYAKQKYIAHHRALQISREQVRGEL